MKIHSLELHNFMVHKKFKRKFGDKPVIGFLGYNRSGKSGVIEAVRYALYGKSRAESEKDLIRRGSGEMWVKLVLSEGDKKYTILRGRDQLNKGLLEVKGVDKKKEAQEIINDLMGMNDEEFMLTSYFQQSQINQFMDLGGTRKKEYFMRWMKNMHWKDLEKAVNDDIRLCQFGLDANRAKQLALGEQLYKEHFTDEDISILKTKIKNYKSKKAKIKKYVLSMEVGPSEARRLEEDLEAIDDEEEDFLVQLHFDPKKLKKIDISQEQALYKRVKKIEKKIDGASNWLKNSTSMTGTCPILKESCDRIHSSKAEIKKRRRLLESLKETQFDLQLLEQKIMAAKSLPGLKKIEERRKALKDRLKLYDSVEAVRSLEEVVSLDKHIYQMTHQLGRMSQARKNIDKLQDSIENLEVQISKAEKKLGNLKYVAFMFGKNGIPSQEIENAFDQIQEEINYVLSDFGTDLEIEFKADRELSAWEDLCVSCQWQFPKGTRLRECKECGAERRKKRKDDLQLRVLDGGTDESFHMESGGGKTIISFAIRIALTLLLHRQTGSNFNVLFLDEVDAVLDDLNRDKFMKLVTKTLIDKLGIEQIFWISHFQDIQESIPHVLLVEKQKDYSKTRWM